MLRFAFRNLVSRPVRSILALLGLTVAIAGMVGLFSIATGIDDTVGKTFGRIPGLAAMQPGAPIPLFSRLPIEWADEMAKIPGVRTARSEVWGRAQMVEGKPIFNPPRFLFGTDDHGERIRLQIIVVVAEDSLGLDHLGDREADGGRGPEGRDDLESGPGYGRAGVENLARQAAGVGADLRGGEGRGDDTVVPFARHGRGEGAAR